MTNRERYILRVNELDLMMQIQENLKYYDTGCPIFIISRTDDEYGKRCRKHEWNCEKCCQEWLNEEVQKR